MEREREEAEEDRGLRGGDEGREGRTEEGCGLRLQLRLYIAPGVIRMAMVAFFERDE